MNGVDLSQFMKEVVLIDHPAEIKGTVAFTRDVFADAGLYVTEDLQLLWLQGCSLKEWANDAVYLDQQSSILGQ